MSYISLLSRVELTFQVLTIFSVSSYYASSSNLGAYVKIDVSMTPRVIQFDAPKTKLITRLVFLLG